MTHENSLTLTFDELDSLAFASQRGRFDPATLRLSSGALGPIFELRLLAKAGVLPWPGGTPWLNFNGTQPMIEALSNRRRHLWVCPMSTNSGVYRTFRSSREEGSGWTEFGIAVQNAAMRTSGLPRKTAAQLVGAIGELQDNIYEHSKAAETGIVAFRATPGQFECVVSDYGIGTLDSLRSCSEYQDLNDHGQALRLALSPGVSRYGTGSGRGTGFQQLFVGLANLTGSLRFRSGDHALIVEGREVDKIPFHLRQKTMLKGFLASVVCYA